MKFYGQKPLVFTFIIVFFSCERNVTLSKKAIHYDPRVHMSRVMPGEKVPAGVREILSEEPIPKFPLAYYLIQEEDTKLFRPYDFDQKITDQLSLMVSGVKYYKLFVHPDSDSAYSFLTSAYRYVGPTETEFVAAPIPGYQAVVVWNPKTLSRQPFIVKMGLEDRTLQVINSRRPAEAGLSPQIAGLVFNRKINGSNKKIQGQQITALPEFQLRNK